MPFAALIDAVGEPLPGAPLGALLTAQALALPEAPALTFGDRTIRFAELDAAANRRARHLAATGIGAGDRVIVSMPNRPEFVEAVYALWKLGATPCPVSHRITAEEFRAIAALAQARCVIGTAATPEGETPLYDIDEALPAGLDAAPLPPATVTPWRIITSGGSTGRPKLIVDPKPSAWGPDKEGRGRGPRIALAIPGPLYHSAPFSYAMNSIAQGSHVVCFAAFDPRDWIAAVERHRPVYAYLVPTMMHRIARLPVDVTMRADLSAIETLIHMAAPCAPDVKRWWIARLGARRILEVYGGSERIGATAITGDEWLLHPGSVGKPVPEQGLVILDEAGAPVPTGCVGEIYFRRPAAATGTYAYLGAASRVRGECDSFGDLGWLDEAGYLYIADRRTDMIVVGGSNVFPAEIEAAIETVAGVACCAVIGLPDADMGNALHAIVELAPDVAEPADGPAFLHAALARLEPIKRPRTVEFTRLPIRDDAGKVRRSALREARLAAAG